MTKTALIVGAGSGISASFARLLAKDGYRIALASEAHKPGRRDQGYDACLRCG
jgi:NAD(P)-dependent dehydrogenase (short-subunit alcohol dehydrogenase family)